MKQGKIRFIKLASILMLVFSLVSCKFRPIYGDDHNAESDFLQNITIAPIPSLEGIDCYNHLKRLFPLRYKATYRLETTLYQTEEYGIIQSNSNSVHKLVVMRIKYKLIEIDTNKQIISGDFSRISSYGANSTPYNVKTNQRETSKLLAIMCAEEIRNRIILFFASNKK
jgi:hypothetical protein